MVIAPSVMPRPPGRNDSAPAMEVEQIQLVRQRLRVDRAELVEPALERRLAAEQQGDDEQGGERPAHEGIEILLVQRVAADQRAVEVDA
jgi:hypothetical protein